MSLFILPLSLSEASSTFVGLEAQAVVRSFLGPAPILVILSGASYIVLEIIRERRTVRDLGVYLFASLLTLAFVWPTTSTVNPADVQAQAASGQPVNSAQELLPGRAALQIPRAEVDLLVAITSMWVDVGRAINVEGDKPFSEVMPISWLMKQRLKADTTSLIRDWTSVCIMPARRRLLETGTSIGYEALLPFQGSALYTEMSALNRQFRNQIRNCGALGTVILDQARAEITALLTPGGNSMSQLWSSEIGISPDEVVKFYILREVTRASGPEISPTSLAGLYGSLRVGRSVTAGVFTAISGLLNVDPSQVASGLGRAFSFGAVDVVAELTVAIESLVGRALFVTKFSSDIVGALQAVILAPFAFVALVALAPGKHVITLVAYLYLLIAVYSMPFGWSLIDLLSDIALSRVSFGGLVSDPIGTLEALGSALVIVTVGMWVVLLGLAFAILMPVIGGTVMVVRSVRGL